MKRMFRKKGGTVWSGFVFLRTVADGDIFKHSNEIMSSITGGHFGHAVADFKLQISETAESTFRRNIPTKSRQTVGNSCAS